MLESRNELPSGFLSVTAQDLHQLFDGPTLIHLAGARTPPIFVSIMLHGNEDVGLKAIQASLAKLHGKPMPRELLLFVGNVAAAKHGLRKLPQQEDFNRVWPGTDHTASALSECMRQVVDYARHTGVFVSLDLHNNTGTNPLYSCIDQLDARTLQLGLLFSRTMVYFRVPRGVQSAAFSELCPSITCECGKVGDTSGVERASQLIDACLHMLELPSHQPPPSDYHLLHTIGIMKIGAESSIAFGDASLDADLCFPDTLDHLNFRELPAGSVFGWHRPGSAAQLSICNEHGQDVMHTILSVENDAFVLRRAVTPAMLTMNVQVIRDDCLGYLMEEYPLSPKTA